MLLSEQFIYFHFIVENILIELRSIRMAEAAMPAYMLFQYGCNRQC